ncbi:oogenesis-related [Antennarius striatus]|uniref:oogenesis-related n=1 Tax=Antennarius striatus TaxID=241820 RepID=UPI0035B07BAB
MTVTEIHRDVMGQEQDGQTEDRVVRRTGVFRFLQRGFLWPFGVVVRTFRWFGWIFGFRQPQDTAPADLAVTSPGRQNLSGRKRLSRVTRLLLFILPRWAQGSLGYPVSKDIGRTLSPEIRASPTKPCGKGNKRKQDALDEDEEDPPTWVEALSQELADDEGLEEDPDYEPSTVETESEEYRSNNSTESDIEIPENGMVVIEDVITDVEPSTQSEDPPPAV